MFKSANYGYLHLSAPPWYLDLDWKIKDFG